MSRLPAGLAAVVALLAAGSSAAVAAPAHLATPVNSRALIANPLPPVTDVIVRGDTRRITLTWHLPGRKDVVGAEVVRYPGAAVVFRGAGSTTVDSEVRAGAHYRYVVMTYDRANIRSRGVRVEALAEETKLIQPQGGAVLTTPPLLSWRSVEGANYYNVQLWAVQPSGLVKILSIWPTTTRFQLPREWKYQGKPQRLTKGTYRWYVWPGVGSIALGNYGELIGSSTFTVTR